MTRLRDLHEKWLEEPEYREEFERLGPEFKLARALIEARAAAGSPRRSSPCAWERPNR